ncbi:MAG: DoxX family protein [Flavobacteriaceae bacterium]|nr:DoxX family protein [Flavobacteriaceae bacterium]MDC1459278.1 DoxX family protein [Flavobacteriaceae bacterium]MDG1032192.1 DoxX family protein [Flavobacteriaceae bacterium]MDG1343219.1 DoxX family protein [Flavobacteriaceae bacterium]|tara:strand:- start:257 stop:619 length:363 start_codon:yes stop_codon:yes gene_type:complete
MEYAKPIIQLILALGIYNVWIINYTKGSKYRGGNSTNMSEEFQAYGFRSWFMKIVGFSKLTLATLLIAGIWFPYLVEPSAFLIGTLMVGALFAHLKINDPFVKSIPALIMLILCSTLIIL